MHLLGLIASWVIGSAIFACLAFMIAGAVIHDRPHKQRQVRAGELRRQQAAHWESLKDALPGSARDTGDMPSSWDPHIVEKPRTPREGE
jgi:hypothetical protein